MRIGRICLAVIALCGSLMAAAPDTKIPVKSDADMDLFSTERQRSVSGEKDPAVIDADLFIPAYEPNVLPVDAGKSTPMFDAKWVNPYTGFGTFAPVSSYSKRYGAASRFETGCGLTVLLLHGFSPCIEANLTEMETNHREGRVDARMKMMSLCGGFEWRYLFYLPNVIVMNTFLHNAWCVSARVLYGGTRISFTSDDQTTPLVETVGTVRGDIMLSYAVYSFFELGIKSSYERIFTQGVPLDGVGLSIFAGYRL